MLEDNQIEKSWSDEKLYRYIVLNNGIKTLLISDKTTDKASAAMNVAVGYFSDPDEIPGLAHFCEHMLFLGTKKYPDENEYSSYLAMNAGRSNAYTSSTNTNYIFDVNPDYFEGALDRFAQFFIAPLFTDSATDRELKAVDSEHNKNLTSDTWRLYQLDKSTSNPAHPYFKFATGDRKTLEFVPKEKGINVRSNLLAFHEKYYYSQNMSLVLLGRESLNELQEKAERLFEAVPGKGKDDLVRQANRYKFSVSPFTSLENEMSIYVVPIKDSFSLSFHFNVPISLYDLYDCDPSKYFSHLIGHEGKGSILSLLKARNLALTLSAGVNEATETFCVFSITIECTPEGIQTRRQEIIDIVFTYLSSVVKIEEWIYEEIKKVNEIKFRFQSAKDPFSYTSGLASALQHYPPSHVLSAEILLRAFNSEMNKFFHAHLTKEHCRLFVVHKGVRREVPAMLNETWYRTEYFVEKGVDWKTNEEALKLLHLPNRNLFLPGNFQIFSSEKRDEEDSRRAPSLILSTPLAKVWHKLDYVYRKPKGKIYCILRTPMAYASPRSSALSAIVALVLKDRLNEFAYDAAVAGLQYGFNNTVQGFGLEISGYNDKLHVLLRKILDEVCALDRADGDEEALTRLVGYYTRQLENFSKEQPYQIAMYENATIVNAPFFTQAEKLASLRAKPVTMGEMVLFASQTVKQVVEFEFLCMGNVERHTCLEISAMVVDRLKASFPFHPNRPKLRSLPAKCWAENIKPAFDSNQTNCAVEMCVQIGAESPVTSALFALLVYLGEEPAFNRLRTNQQLGYIVSLGGRRELGVLTLRVVVQSGRADVDCAYLIGRCKAFLQTELVDVVASMSEEEFEKNRALCAKKKMEKDLTLENEFRRWCVEIESGTLWFNQARTVSSYILRITKKEMLQFINQYVAGGGGKYLISGVERPLRDGEMKKNSHHDKAAEFPALEKVLNMQSFTPQWDAAKKLLLTNKAVVDLTATVEAMQTFKDSCGFYSLSNSNL